MSLNNCIGSTINIIYIDRNDQISKRKIKIQSIKGGVVRAYCFASHGPRIFRAENILAYERVSRYA